MAGCTGSTSQYLTAVAQTPMSGLTSLPIHLQNSSQLQASRRSLGTLFSSFHLGMQRQCKGPSGPSSLQRVWRLTVDIDLDRHFHWMAEHGVDGAFLQRFAGQCDLEAGNEGIRHIRDEVGDRVREAAEREGRVFAIM